MDPKDNNNDDNRANQLNPNNDEYRGSSDADHDYNNDNHANQLNPNNDEYKGE